MRAGILSYFTVNKSCTLMRVECHQAKFVIFNFVPQPIRIMFRMDGCTAISLTSFAVTEFLLKLDCQRGILYIRNS